MAPHQPLPATGTRGRARALLHGVEGLAACAGASLVQLYTGVAYGGPALVPRLKRELAECLAADGFQSVAEAVGADHRSP